MLISALVYQMKQATMRYIFLISFALTLTSLPILADDKPSALRIYRSLAAEADPFSFNQAEAIPGGYALVRTQRTLDLKSGHNNIQLHDLPHYLNPSDVSFRALNDPEHTVLLAQRFEYDPVTLDRLVEHNLNATVTVYFDQGAAASYLTGKLLSNTGGLSLETSNGIVSNLTEFNRVDFPNVGDNANSTPTLYWEIDARSVGTQPIELSYSTAGIAWRADYTASLDNDANCNLALAGWAEIVNRSGIGFRNTTVQLMAGEVNRQLSEIENRPKTMARSLNAAPEMASERPVGDYHEYTLDGVMDLPTSSISRYALLPAATLVCERSYVFEPARLRAEPEMAPITERNYGLDTPQPIASTLSFHAPRALPAGRLSVRGEVTNAAPLLLGETMLRDTPQNENISFSLGNAFDLRGERMQTDFKTDRDKRTLDEGFQLRLHNHSAQPKTVIVREHLYRWSDWEIIQSSAKYEKRNADTIEFKVDLPARSDAKVSYSVRYHWSESLN